MSKTKKIVIIILGIILFFVAVFSIFYAIAPREFLQLFLNDTKYTELTLAKNGKDIAKIAKTLSTEKQGYAFMGTIDAEVDKSLLLNNEKIADSISDLLQDVEIAGSLMTKDGTLNLTAGLSDDDGAILTGEAIINKDLKIFKIAELDTGWMKYEKPESDTPSDDEPTEEKEAEYDIKVLSEAEVRVGETSASGEAICISIDSENFKILLSDIQSYIPDEYKDKFDTSMLTSFIDKNEVDTINLRLFVNKKNEIVAIELDLEGEESIYLIGVLDKEKSKVGVEISSDLFNVVTEITGTKAPFKDFEIPSNDEITVYDPELLKSAFIKYFIGDFISTHDGFEDIAISAVSSIISEFIQGNFSFKSEDVSSITDSFTKMFGDLIGGNK